MGWVGFLAVVPWIQALGWAFKPTDVIDVRYLPAERKTRNRGDDRAADRPGAGAARRREEPPAESPTP